VEPRYILKNADRFDCRQKAVQTIHQPINGTLGSEPLESNRQSSHYGGPH